MLTSSFTTRTGATARLPLYRLLALLALLTSWGCGEPAEIRRYQVDKPVAQHRMLAAIVPRDDKCWFFKVTGPNQKLERQAATFLAFVRSVRFDEQGTPQWDLPSAWREGPPSGMRFATVMMDTDPDAPELTVTPLALPPGDLDGYVLQNVNRWRDQLRLSPITAAQMADETQRIDVAGIPVTLVNMVGNLGASSMGTAPFASGAGPAAPAAGAAPPSGELDLGFTAPEGWTEGQRVASRGGVQISRLAAFEVQEGEQQVEITVTQMPGGPQRLVDNIQRWRDQVQLPEISAEEIGHEIDQIPVDGLPGNYVQLIGPQQAILGVVVFREGFAFFIKLQGDRELAQRQRDHFEAFVQSIKFNGSTATDEP